MALLTPASVQNFAPGPGSQSFLGEWKVTSAVPFSGAVGIWHVPYVANATAPTTLAPIVGRLYAMPFPVSRRCTIDTIAVELTASGGAGSVLRCGIYQAISRTNLYPGSLVLDAGEWDSTVAASVLTKSVSQSLGPDQLYWLAIMSGVAAPTVRAMSVGGLLTLGVQAAGGANGCGAISTNPGYGALATVAATYPASGSFNSNAQAMIAVHYSA